MLWESHTERFLLPSLLLSRVRLNGSLFFTQLLATASLLNDCLSTTSFCFCLLVKGSHVLLRRNGGGASCCGATFGSCSCWDSSQKGLFQYRTGIFVDQKREAFELVVDNDKRTIDRKVDRLARKLLGIMELILFYIFFYSLVLLTDSYADRQSRCSSIWKKESENNSCWLGSAGLFH